MIMVSEIANFRVLATIITKAMLQKEFCKNVTGNSHHKDQLSGIL